MLHEVCAVVLNYRTPGKTLACLQSLAKEGLARVVMVENSEDAGATLQAMGAGLADLRGQGLVVDVLDSGRNLGFAAGVNLALRHIRATGTAPVLLVNSDARLEPGALRLLCQAVESGADVAAPMLVSSDGRAHAPVFNYQPYFALLTPHPLWGTFRYLSGACMLLAPSLVRPHLFDEDFFFYGEDVMLGATLAGEGRQCCVVPEAHAHHEGSGSARNGSYFYEYHINRGHWLLADRLFAGQPLRRALALAGRGVVLPLRALVRAWRLRSRLPLTALRHATRNFRSGQPATVSP